MQGGLGGGSGAGWALGGGRGARWALGGGRGVGWALAGGSGAGWTLGGGSGAGWAVVSWYNGRDGRATWFFSGSVEGEGKCGVGRGKLPGLTTL